MASNATTDNTTDKIFITIWLDAEVNINEVNQKIQQKLRMGISCLKTFETKNECEKYIRSTSSQEQLLLIVSGRFGREFVPSIHQLQQIISIYVYCQDVKGNEQWANHFSKVKAVVDRLDELISRIKSEQEKFLLADETQLTSIPVLFDKKNKSNTHYTIEHAYSHLLSDVLRRMNPDETDKNEFISVCRDYYKGNQTELNYIDEFQRTYSSDKAIWWYTRGCFIYAMLSKAFRTQDTNTIFLSQFFIRDLHGQIRKRQCQTPVRVYRGQNMLDNEINNLRKSVGSFIFINMLFATSMHRHRALRCLNTGNTSGGVHRVLLEIDADPAVITTKSFGDISRDSKYPDDGEALFSIGSCFRIVDVQRNDNQIWYIQMTLCGDDDPDVKPFFDELNEKYGYNDGEAAFFSFSRVLRAMKKFDEAEKYCHRLLPHLSSDDSLLVDLYDELAEISSGKGDYHMNALWHQKSLDIKKKTEFNSFDNSGAATKSDDDCASPEIRSINDSEPIEAAANSPTLDQQESTNNYRFTDGVEEKHDILLPIEGHEKMPLVTLEDAVVPLIPILPDIRRKVYMAKLKCENPADGLTSDQSAAIMLYTMEWEPQEQCLYFALNAHLRAADRKKLKPWFLYLKLILTGLSRLPSIQQTVFRGVKCDLSAEHPENKPFFWWGFSSCTKTMNVLKSDQFLGNSGIRSFFIIECINGKDIRRHSYYQNEEEILLLPATYFRVVSCFEMAPNLHAIQLVEIKSKFPYLEPVD